VKAGYNAAHADRVIRFVRSLKHTKGEFAGKPFNLQPWQEEILRTLFGTLRADGTRQYRTCYVEIPRKNGKSEIAAAVALVLLFLDNEAGAEIYSAAADRDQAGIVFSVAAQMIRQEPALSSRVKIVDSTKRIVYGSSLYRVLSSEAGTKHGYNPSGIIFDELHAQPNRELWDVLTTGSGTRRQPLVFAITTAGYDRASICWEQHDYASKVARGLVPDDSFLPVIYAADLEDDWTDPKVWAKANPALGTFRRIDEMEAACEKAKRTPALENTFRRLYLDQWTSQATRFLSMHVWDASAGEVVADDLAGRECYAGLDLASTTDIAALVLVFPDRQGGFDVLPHFWIPEETLTERMRRQSVAFEAWVRAGLVEATPGNSIDYDTITARIRELGERYAIREIAFDRWNATQLAQKLDGDGFTVVPFGQGYASMSGPTKDLLALVLAKKVRHGAHPVLRWMADNLQVTTDAAGNIKPDKGKSTEKIDGMVALIMALDRAVRNENARAGRFVNVGSKTAARPVAAGIRGEVF
jgi:phage terminase large subunit-like protein